MGLSPTSIYFAPFSLIWSYQNRINKCVSVIFAMDSTDSSKMIDPLIEVDDDDKENQRVHSNMKPPRARKEQFDLIEGFYRGKTNFFCFGFAILEISKNCRPL